MIKPLKITDQEEHAVLIYNQEELDPANHTCGVRNVGRKQGLIRTSRSLKRPEVSAAFRPTFVSTISVMIYEILVHPAMTRMSKAQPLFTYLNLFVSFLIS